MGDESDKVVQMGADNNSSATSRLATLQTRKQQLEERISAKNKELRRLCIQEAELTGVMPLEYPLEPGETTPTFRKRVGTAFEYPQNIINSLANEDETILHLETKIEVQKKIAEAALQLANNPTMSKAIRRDNMSLYRKTKQDLDFMEERLKLVKAQGNGIASQNQLKQKKKPRPLLDVDTISTKSSQGEETLHRNYLQLQYRNHQSRYSLNKYHVNTNSSYMSDSDTQSYHVPDDNLIPPLNKLALTNYSNNNDDSHIHHTVFSHSSPNIYQHQHQQQQQQYHQHHPHPHPHHSQYLINSQTLPHMPGHYQREKDKTYNYPSYSHTLLYNNNNNNRRYHIDDRKYNYHPDTYAYPYPYKHMTYTLTQSQPQPQSQSQLHTQPQYEPELSSAGLGGHWFKTETGETIWCPTHEDMSPWHTDKRFGSLDRRKAKHIRSKPSASVDVSTSTSSKQTPTVPVPVPVRPIRTERRDRQLVRTQSLGSVGAQTVDSVWPSDDNSSYDSDINELNAATRKLKQKGWCETSVDGPGPISTSELELVRSPSVSMPSPSSVTPRTSRPILEIPAESNPSPMHVETNMDMEMFNNIADLPKNCTVVQAGQCKPYREVTKPFEMSDFYKYSTKFRERNSDKQEYDQQEDSYQKGVYQPLQPMKCQPLNTSNRYVTSPCADTSVDSSVSVGLNASNVAVAEHFSAEMNAWYQTQTHSHGDTSPVLRGRSTATLV